MSKNVKYYSSEHFNAPVMKGDRWGYCVEMLRKVLVEGFNQRVDLNSVEIIDLETIKLTFGTPHNYVTNQTIKLSEIPFIELNDEFRIDSVNDNIVTCKSYNVNLTSLIGQTQTGSFKSIVAPCGFIEKFKDGNRSVFTTDEQEAFFYIDDRDGGSKWKNSSNDQTALICPIVFMADKMTDIDTVTGKNIVPFDSSNPDFYKKVDYLYPGISTTSSATMGLWNFLTFGHYNNSTQINPNTSAQQQNVVKWEIIGNGRLFFFMPYIIGGTNVIERKHIFAFGKYNGSIKSAQHKHYLLFANAPDVSSGYAGSYSYRRVYSDGAVMPWNDRYINSSTLQYPKTDLGYTMKGLLCINNKTSNFYTVPDNVTRNSSVFVSGITGEYPDPLTKKYYVKSMKIYNSESYYCGTLPGLMWTFNSSNIFNSDKKITKYKFNNKIKRMYSYNWKMNTNWDLNPQSDSNNNYVYNISLEYEDWNNYE